jgi:hypothetical protein
VPLESLRAALLLEPAPLEVARQGSLPRQGPVSVQVRMGPFSVLLPRAWISAQAARQAPEREPAQRG